MTYAKNHSLLILVLAAIIAPAVPAQTGPLEPRLVIAGQPYPKFDPDLGIDFLSATAELTVDANGKVTAVRIAQSSGNDRFDAIVQKYYSTFRLIPAVSATGQPVPAVSEVRFRVAIDDPQSGRLRGPEDFVQAEVKRIQRMKCSDFLQMSSHAPLPMYASAHFSFSRFAGATAPLASRSSAPGNWRTGSNSSP